MESLKDILDTKYFTVGIFIILTIIIMFIIMFIFPKPYTFDKPITVRCSPEYQKLEKYTADQNSKKYSVDILYRKNEITDESELYDCIYDFTQAEQSLSSLDIIGIGLLNISAKKSTNKIYGYYDYCDIATRILIPLHCVYKRTGVLVEGDKKYFNSCGEDIECLVYDPSKEFKFFNDSREQCTVLYIDHIDKNKKKGHSPNKIKPDYMLTGI